MIREDEIGDLVGGFNQILKTLSERESALARSDAFSRMVAKNIPGLLAYWTSDLRCAFANDNHLGWWGLSPQDMVGKHISDLSAPDLLAAPQESLQAALRGEDQYFEREYAKCTGERVYAFTRYIAYRNADTMGPDGLGKVDGFFVQTTDITDRRNAELEARNAGQVIRGAIEAIDEAFVLYDAQDRLVFCNEKYRTIYVKSADLIVPGATFESIVRNGAERGDFPDAVGRVDAWVAERLAAHQAASADRVQRLDDGRVLRIVERKMPDGQIVGFRIDITELMHAKEAAEHANVSKSQFLANMSHEIRTPMNAILGMVKLLQNTDLTARQLDYASKTEGAAKSLLGLLNDILDFSKIEAGKLELDPQALHIDRLLRDLSVIVSANVGAKPVEVLYDIGPDVPRVLLGDAMRLQQVLINLSGNALKFTAEGEVVIEIKQVARTGPLCTLCFAVRDSGIGIAPENQAKIFAGFSQAEASTTRRFGGTGLGLSISKRLVNLMGGELELESALGEGSTFFFTISLPVVDLAQDAAEGPLAQRMLEPLDVLVVDDNPVALDLLSAMALSWGWQVDRAASGEQAVAIDQARREAGKPPYQAIFVDWDMQGADGRGIDGWETLGRMQTSGKPPIRVMVTSHGRDFLNQRSAQEQAMLDAFLVKPVTASMLYEAVTDARMGVFNLRTIPRTTADRVQHLAGMRLLVVEDNLINQQVAQELLSGEGAFVQLADNGALGVQAVADANPPFDAVLMDLQMPVMDGFTATAALRQTWGHNDLPIIAMTANAMASDREACLAAGMNDHVGKPFDLPYLIAVLLEQTGRSAKVVTSDRRVAPAIGSGLQGAAAANDLDVEGALARMGGNTALYGRSLQSYLTDLQMLPDELEELLQRGQFGDAARLLHTSKGLSATMGANAMAQAARTAESLTKDETATLDLAGLGLQIRQAVAVAEEALRPVLARFTRPEPTVASATGPAGEAVRADLHALEALLKDSDMSALDAFAQLRVRHATLAGPQFDKLEEAMADLDFAAGEVACRALLHALGG